MEKKPPGPMNSIQQLFNKIFFFRSGTGKPVESSPPLSAQIMFRCTPHYNRSNRGYFTGGSPSQKVSFSPANKHPRLQRGCLRKAFATPNLKRQFQFVCLISIIKTSRFWTKSTQHTRTCRLRQLAG